MEGIEGLEDRQRVDRWLEESQYLIGRIIPAYVDDRDRMRSRLEVIEQDNERLRGELGEARREIAGLRTDLEIHRTERANVADSFTAIVEHLAALQKPIDDVSRRLHSSAAPITTEA
jgi:septal ring factor EnvC (AmiA/AmiB activator)